jgi:BlaI family penicillinase repressor
LSRRKTAPVEDLSRRERQIMDVLLRHRQATALQVRDEIPDPPSYDAVRTTLRILAEKGHAVCNPAGPRHIYAPAMDFEAAQEHALTRLVKTFYQGSAARAALALLRHSEIDLDEKELDRLEATLTQVEEEAPPSGKKLRPLAGGRVR